MNKYKTEKSKKKSYAWLENNNVVLEEFRIIVMMESIHKNLVFNKKIKKLKYNHQEIFIMQQKCKDKLDYELQENHKLLYCIKANRKKFKSTNELIEIRKEETNITSLILENKAV